MERAPSRRGLLFFRCFALGGLLAIALGGTLRVEDTVLDRVKAPFNNDIRSAAAGGPGLSHLPGMRRRGRDGSRSIF